MTIFSLLRDSNLGNGAYCFLSHDSFETNYKKMFSFTTQQNKTFFVICFKDIMAEKAVCAVSQI
jgi:hypothetical protein